MESPNKSLEEKQQLNAARVVHFPMCIYFFFGGGGVGVLFVLVFGVFFYTTLVQFKAAH